MSCGINLDKLYKTNEPGIRNIVEICDSYFEHYNDIKSNLMGVNDSLVSWYNTWIGTYDYTDNDISLSEIYSSDKTIFSELQVILTGMDNFYTSVKNYKLKNGETIGYTFGSTTNQVKNLKNKHDIGKLNNLAIDISSNLVLDTTSDSDLSTNKFLHNTRYQIGIFPSENFVVDLHFDGSNPGKISDLYNVIINGDDTLIQKNNRLIQQLSFSMNTITNLKNVLVRFI